jgi:hypothetical protein
MALSRRALVLGMVAVIGWGCAGEKSLVTADHAKKIAKGMSESQVMGLLGRPALQATQTLPPPVNVTGALWTFQGPKDRVEVIFEESKVTAVRLNGTPILE